MIGHGFDVLALRIDDFVLILEEIGRRDQVLLELESVQDEGLPGELLVLREDLDPPLQRADPAHGGAHLQGDPTLALDQTDPAVLQLDAAPQQRLVIGAFVEGVGKAQ